MTSTGQTIGTATTTGGVGGIGGAGGDATNGTDGGAGGDRRPHCDGTLVGPAGTPGTAG